MTPEGKVKAKIKALFTKYNIWYAMPLGTTLGRYGIPDFLACAHGKFLAVEAKSGRNRPSPAQAIQLAAIKNAGGQTLVVNEDNLDELESLCKSLCMQQTT